MNELVALEKGERSAPLNDKDLELKVSIACRKITAEIGSSEQIWPVHVYRCAEPQKQKLDYLIHVRKLPMLIQPKPGSRFTYYYTNFACAFFDPNNYTLWNDQNIDVPDELFQTFLVDPSELEYLDHAWCLKRFLFESLTELGMDTEVDQIYNCYINVFRACLNRHKFSYLKKTYPNSNRNYEELAKNNDGLFDKWMDLLTNRSYLNRNTDKGQDQSELTWKNNFKKIACFGLIFDPLHTGYSLSFFEACNESQQIYLKYKKFVEEAQRIAKNVNSIQGVSYLRCLEDGSASHLSASIRTHGDEVDNLQDGTLSSKTDQTMMSTTKRLSGLKLEASSSTSRTQPAKKIINPTLPDIEEKIVEEEDEKALTEFSNSSF